MAQNSWPFYGQETTETEFSKWARVLSDSGISTGLALTPGGGMNINLSAGFAIVRGHAYENTSSLALTIGTAPASGQTRLDAIILRMDQAANTVMCVVKPGTANSSGGVLPSLVQTDATFEFMIAPVTVTGGTATITSGMITELRPMLASGVTVNTTARRPAPATMTGRLFYNTTTGQLQYSNGSAWVDLVTVSALTGTVPVDQGGTGATTAKLALRALGIYIQPTAPAHAVGRVWIPGPEPV